MCLGMLGWVVGEGLVNSWIHIGLSLLDLQNMDEGVLVSGMTSCKLCVQVQSFVGRQAVPGVMKLVCAHTGIQEGMDILQSIENLIFLAQLLEGDG